MDQSFWSLTFSGRLTAQKRIWRELRAKYGDTIVREVQYEDDGAPRRVQRHLRGCTCPCGFRATDDETALDHSLTCQYDV